MILIRLLRLLPIFVPPHNLEKLSSASIGSHARSLSRNESGARCYNERSDQAEGILEGMDDRSLSNPLMHSRFSAPDERQDRMERRVHCSLEEEGGDGNKRATTSSFPA